MIVVYVTNAEMLCFLSYRYSEVVMQVCANGVHNQNEN